MFPQVAPKFFKTRKDGPKNLGKDPAKKVAAAASGDAKSAAAGSGKALEGSVHYVVTLNGKEHSVKVAAGK
jgi:methylmalonyl-CoA carboxyltransferase 5S subunit